MQMQKSLGCHVMMETEFSSQKCNASIRDIISLFVSFYLTLQKVTSVVKALPSSQEIKSVEVTKLFEAKNLSCWEF